MTRRLAWFVWFVLAVAGCGDDKVGPADGPVGDAALAGDASNEKSISEFGFFAGDNPGLPANFAASITGEAIAVTLPVGTSPTALVARFAAVGTVSVSGTPQSSGITANDFTNPVIYRVTAADGSSRDYTVTVTITPSTGKEITAFAIPAGLNSGHLSTDATVVISGHSITATVPHGTDAAHLVATFTTTAQQVLVGATPQVSGTTSNDFTSPVTYHLVAADSTTADYTVTVIVLSNANALTSFTFKAANNPGLQADANGVISGTTVTVSLAQHVDPTALVATFATTGATVSVGGTSQTSGVTPNDFTSPVTYRVTAQDLETRDYTVTVMMPAANAKHLTAFSFTKAKNPALAATADGVITGTNVAVSLPQGTTVTSLVASFTTDGVSAKVGGTVQVSGTTPNDFTNPVVYRITAFDGSFTDYTVTVTLVAPPSLSITKLIDDGGGQVTAYFTVGTGTTGVKCVAAENGGSDPPNQNIQTVDPCTSPVTFTNRTGSNFHMLSITTTDSVGNHKTVSVSFKLADQVFNLTSNGVYVESGPTTAAGGLGPAATTNRRLPAFTVAMVGPVNGTEQCGVDGTLGACQPCPNDSTYVPIVGLYCFQPASGLALGAHTFSATATDAATSSAMTGSTAFSVTGPVVGIDSAPPAVTSNVAATVTFHVADAVSTSCTVDGTTTTGCTSPFSKTITSGGSHTFTVTATDVHGATTSKSTKWYLTSLPPSGQVATDRANYATSDPIVVTWSNITNDRVTLLSGTTVVAEMSTGGSTSGSVMFAGGLASTGSYRALVRMGTASTTGPSADFAVTATCPSNVVSGDVDVTSVAASTTYATVTAITGKLTISAPTVHSPMEFPCLASVGTLWINRSAHTDLPVSFPLLTTVGNDVAIGGTPDLPDLASINGTLIIDAASAFANNVNPHANAPRLATVHAISLQDDPTLGPDSYTVIPLPSLVSVGSDLTVAMALASMSGLDGLTMLRSIGGKATLANIRLQGLDNVTYVGSDLTVTMDYAESAQNTLALPFVHVGGSVSITVNPYLTDLSWPALVDVGGRFMVVFPNVSNRDVPQLQSIEAANLVSAPTGFLFLNLAVRYDYAYQIASQVSPAFSSLVVTPVDRCTGYCP